MVQYPEWFSPDPDESVVWQGKPRVRRILTTVASSVVWSVAALGAAWAIPTYLPGVASGIPLLALWGGALLVVAIQVLQVVWAYLRVQGTDYVLTDRNVYKKTGVLSEEVTRVGIDRIQNTELQKDVTGNLFDWGTVKLRTAGDSGTAIAITDLDNPEEFRDELRPLIDAAGGPGEERFGRGAETIDPETLDELVSEARKLRESATSVEANFEQ